MSEWISVKDRLPRHGSAVLAFDPDIGVEVLKLCADGGSGFSLGHWHYALSGRFLEPVEGSPVTHWMPLPEPPSLPPTKEEALREAILAIESLEQPSLTTSRQVSAAACGVISLLPRLRAALGET